MMELAITYRDFSGEITQRRISDFRPEGTDAIDAFCHTRNARRTFKLTNVVAAADANTGEIVSNVWKAFGLSRAPDGRERLVSLVADALPAIKALKFFALLTRGFARRERAHLIQFTHQHAETSAYTETEIEEWLQELWCGDVSAFREGNTREYEAILRAIPAILKPSCRSVAFAVSAGSGRRRVSSELLERINSEFGT